MDDDTQLVDFPAILMKGLFFNTGESRGKERMLKLELRTVGSVDQAPVEAEDQGSPCWCGCKSLISRIFRERGLFEGP